MGSAPLVVYVQRWLRQAELKGPRQYSNPGSGTRDPGPRDRGTGGGGRG